MNDKENLFKEFPQISEKEWLEKVEKDLKGRAIKELDWHISENIEIAPFYHSLDHIPSVPANKAKNNTWEIGEDILVNDPKIANEQLLKALESGVNAPRIIIDSDWNEQLEILFENVN